MKQIDVLIAVAERGGVENVINMLCPYLQENGWFVRVVQIVWEGVYWVEDGIPFYPLLRRREGNSLADLSDAYQSFLLSEEGKTYLPDIVLACAWPYMTWIAKNVSVNLGLDYKTVSWLHAPVTRYADAGYGGYEALCHADAHLAISTHIESDIRKNLKDATVYRVNNPVDFNVITKDTPTQHINPDTILFIGRLTAEKHVDLIIRALAVSHVPWELTIVGDGETGEDAIGKLKMIAREENVEERVCFKGWRENAWDHVENAVALVLASEYEGFPLTAIEAQARGIPVISTPTDGIVELIKPGINGFLFPFGDAVSLAEVFNAMYDGILPAIKSETCKHAVQPFERDNVLNGFLSVLKQITPQKEISPLSIDILLIRGRHGGFENILYQTAEYLMAHGCQIRFVQMVDTGVNWTPPDADFICLADGKDTVSFDDARGAYAALLKEGNVPGLILAAGWPYTVYIAKGATSDAGLPVPVAAWLHGDIRFYEESDSGGMDILQYADMCFAISNRIADDILDAYPQKVVYRINNTVRREGICYSEDRNHLKLACVSRLSEDKAVAILLYALEQTKKPWELLIAGSGPDENNLRSLVKKLGLSGRVRFLGWQENPWEQLSECRALVVTSLYEGAPLSVLEALSCGMQVVSTPAGFMPEVLQENVTGYLYPFGDPKALAQVLDKLGQTSFTAETAARCRDSIDDYSPETALWDMLCKVRACAECVALPQRYEKGKRDLLVRKEG